MNPPAPLPLAKIDWDKHSAWRRENGVCPTPENAPEVFADNLALEGFAVSEVEPFVSGSDLLASTLHVGGAIDHALRRLTERRIAAARKWLWDQRERARLVEDDQGRRLAFVGGWTNADREAVSLWRDVIVDLLRDGECLCWFVRQPETPLLRGPSNVTPSGVV